MAQNSQSLAVVDIAGLCGVARSTVSYWISKKALPAYRSGNKYMVFVDDLVLFLKSEGQPVPQILLEQVGGIYPLPFRPFKRCWEFWAKDPYGAKCQSCNVFKYQIDECFSARKNQTGQTPKNCHECQYFGEYYGPRVAFIHQIVRPAAVYKDLYLWSGNQAWADLCCVKTDQLIGAGIEELFCPDSLRMFINYEKRRQQRDPTVSDRFRVFFSDKRGEEIEVYLSVSPLIRPSATWLAVVEKAGA